MFAYERHSSFFWSSTEISGLYKHLVVCARILETGQTTSAVSRIAGLMSCQCICQQIRSRMLNRVSSTLWKKEVYKLLCTYILLIAHGWTWLNSLVSAVGPDNLTYWCLFILVGAGDTQKHFSFFFLRSLLSSNNKTFAIICAPVRLVKVGTKGYQSALCCLEFTSNWRSVRFLVGKMTQITPDEEFIHTF